MPKTYAKDCTEGRKMANDLIARMVASGAPVAAPHALREIIAEFGTDNGVFNGFVTKLAESAIADARDRF